MTISSDFSYHKPAERLDREYGPEREAYLQAMAAANTQQVEPQPSREMPETAPAGNETDSVSISPSASLRAERLGKAENGEDGGNGAQNQTEDHITRDGIKNGYSNALGESRRTSESDSGEDAQQRIRELQKQINEVQKGIQQAQTKLAEAKAKLEAKDNGAQNIKPAPQQPPANTKNEAAGESAKLPEQLSEQPEAPKSPDKPTPEGQTPPSAPANDNYQMLQAQTDAQSAQQEISEGTARLGELLQELAAVMKQAQAGAQSTGAEAKLL